MIIKRHSVRAIKKRVSGALESTNDYQELLESAEESLIKLINSLFSFLYHKNPVIKWNAVVAMGGAVSQLAQKDMESARNIIRRLMWNLNDESGGIGWGSAEAMGEILAGNKSLSKEYSAVLLSYGREDGNYQEHELMQRGVLWGIARLCRAWPEFVSVDTPGHIMPYLESGDAAVRGLAAEISGLLHNEDALPLLEALTADSSEIELFLNNSHVVTTVKEQAEKALKKIMEKR